MRPLRTFNRRRRREQGRRTLDNALGRIVRAAIPDAAKSFFACVGVGEVWVKTGDGYAHIGTTRAFTLQNK